MKSKRLIEKVLTIELPKTARAIKEEIDKNTKYGCTMSGLCYVLGMLNKAGIIIPVRVNRTTTIWDKGANYPYRHHWALKEMEGGNAKEIEI